jgi:hypothetical protein
MLLMGKWFFSDSRVNEMAKNYRVINSFENQQRNKCVDIIQVEDGTFRFQEWRRDCEDLHGWFLLQDSLPIAYNTEEKAVSSATKTIIWLRDADS